jgi:hypothetical protein
MTSKPDTRSTPTIDELADMLIRMLSAQLRSYRALTECIERKREAIRAADIEAIASLCHREHTIIQRIGEVEKQRLEVVGSLTERLNPSAARPLGVGEIAGHFDADRGERLAALGEELRGAIESARTVSSIVTRAAEALNRHVSGIMQSVNRLLSDAGVYEKRGRIVAGAALRSAVDIRS